MLNQKIFNLAKKHNVLDRIIKLESDLLNIENVGLVHFFLFDKNEKLKPVMFVLDHSIRHSNTHNKDIKELINNTNNVLFKNNLKRTKDKIEDYEGTAISFVAEFDN